MGRFKATKAPRTRPVLDPQAWAGIVRYQDALVTYTAQTRASADVQRFIINLERDGVEAPVEKEVAAMFAEVQS